ncbi:MAG: hypothetical protein IJ740_05640 [Ruminococcus sp.]|nr:hypothetical protein [Ruminococcus sp.]
MSKYEKEFSQYYELRSAILSDSARKHELCYLKRFDKYIEDNLQSDENTLSESFMCKWISTLQGSSASIENEIIVIRQFLKYLNLSGYSAFIPVIPKVHDDYSPYIFSDEELGQIFASADNTTVKDKKACIYLPIEFPVILRLLFCCGLRIGETVRIKMRDVDLENGVLKLVNTKGDKCSVSTRNHRLSVLNAFSEYAQNRDFEAASVFRANLLRKPHAVKPFERVAELGYFFVSFCFVEEA